MRSSLPLDRAALDKHPLPPVKDGNKDTKGRILVVAGSRDVPGAAILAATAAMRAGAGKLKIATGQSVATQVGVAMPEAMAVGLPENGDGTLAHAAVDVIAQSAEGMDCVVAGPGMPQGDICKRISDILIDGAAPLVLDAALLRSLQPLDQRALNRASLPILLPHAGELASLLDCEEDEIEADPIGCGHRAAQLYQAVILVKGVPSHVVTPDSDCWTYEGGAPGLGVSGSGDTLAGIVGGLLARGAAPLNALLWAVWLHGEAGASLAKKVGPIGFLAREIPEEIPALLPR